MTVTDGELRSSSKLPRQRAAGHHAGDRGATEGRVRLDAELGVPVLPLSSAEEVAPQLSRLLGAVPGRHGRGGGHPQTEATLG